MNLLYITFGSRIDIHYQANFSMLSFFKESQEIDSITVMTDAPAFYGHLAPRVRLIVIDDKTLTEWRGPYDFLWRIKLKALGLLAEQLGEKPIVYLDTDTFLFGPAAEFKNLLSTNALLHENEGTLPSLRTKTERRTWQQIQGKSFGGVTISAKHSMWNAGVVAIPGNRNAQAIALALVLCDAMCEAPIRRRLVEQLALSVALEETYSVVAAKNWVGHYWGNKAEWNDVIAEFFLNHFLTGSSFEHEIESIKSFDFYRIPLRKRRSRMHERWVRLADKLYPFRDVVHLKRS
jgi:hypothetical protein